MLCGVIMLTDPSEVNDLAIAERRSLSTTVLSPKQSKTPSKAPNETNTDKRRSNEYLFKTQRTPTPDISYYVITKQQRKVWERNQISSKKKAKERRFKKKAQEVLLGFPKASLSNIV